MTQGSMTLIADVCASGRDRLRGWRSILWGVTLACGAAQADGLNATGVVGGLSIPSARALGDGTFAVGLGSVQEHQITGGVARNVSHVLGVGLAPGFDLFGRFTENATRDKNRTGYTITRGISDLSVNVKLSAAVGQGDGAARVALGVNDVTGGAVNFKAAYAVGTLPLGPLDMSLGYGHSAGRFRPGTYRPLDGAFGGVSYSILEGSSRSRLTLHVEHDGRQPLIGMRWLSEPVSSFGHARWSVAAHRTGDRGGVPGDTVLTAGLRMPVGDAHRGRLVSAPPPERQRPVSASVESSVSARLGRLSEALAQAGLERVRVGASPGGEWVIQYENRRYGHGELDALGVGVGLAAEAAPAEVRRIVVVVFRAGLPALSLVTDPQMWRQYLRDGYPGMVRGATQVFQSVGPLDFSKVDWLTDGPGPGSAAQIRLLPRLSQTIGTEFAAFDYAVSARAEVSVPTWPGGTLVAHLEKELAHSRNADEGRPFADMRQREGLRTLMVHHSAWWGASALLGGGVGWYDQQSLGVEADAVLPVPGRQDLVQLRGRWLDRPLTKPYSHEVQHAAVYRWVPADGLWVQGGWQRYGDGSAGPSLTITRWWGDVGAHLNYRKGANRQFAGLDLSFPLTPRKSPATGRIQWSGVSQWQHGLRTRITDGGTRSNWVDFPAVRDLRLSRDLVGEMLDGGRLVPAHVDAAFPRMREAFHALAPAHRAKPAGE